MVNKYPEFDRDRYREIFDNGFGEGRYNSVIQGARRTGELQVAAKEAEKSYKARQKEREKAAKAVTNDPLAGFTAPKQSQNRQASNSLLDSIVSGAKKVGSGIARVGSELARFDDIATNTLTAGLKAESEKRIEARAQEAGQDLGLTKYLDARADGDVVGKGLDIAANIAGYIPSGIGATALLRGAGATGQGVRALAQARKAGQSTKGLRGAAVRDAAKEGTIIGGALAVPEAAVRLGLNEDSETSLLDELKFVGVSAALGGALDPLLAVGAPLARDAAQRSLQGTVDNAVVNSTAEEAVRRLAQGNNSPSDVGQQILEQLRTSRNPSASLADQALSRLNASTAPDFSLPQTNRGVPTSAEPDFTSSDSLQNLTSRAQQNGRDAFERISSGSGENVPLRRANASDTGNTLDEIIARSRNQSTGTGARFGEQNTPPTRDPIPPTREEIDQDFIDYTVYDKKANQTSAVNKVRENLVNDLAPVGQIVKAIQKKDINGQLEYLAPKTLIKERVPQLRVKDSAEKSLLQAKGAPSIGAKVVNDRFSPLLNNISKAKNTTQKDLGRYAFAKNGLKRFADDNVARAERDANIEELEVLVNSGRGNSEEAKVLESLIEDYNAYVSVRGATPEVLSAQVAELERNPELLKLYDEFVNIQRQNVEDLYSSGQITEGVYNKLLANDTYISNVRNFEDGGTDFTGPGASRDPRVALERLKNGSEAKVKDPILGAIRNTYNTQVNAIKNDALQFLETYAAIDTDGTLFRASTRPNKNTVTIYQSGNPKYFEVPAPLKNYIDNIDTSINPDVLTNILQKAGTLQRKLTTQYSLKFQLLSVIREAGQSVVNSRTSYTGASAARNLAYGYLDAFAGPALADATKDLPKALRFKSFKKDFADQGGTGFQYIKTSDDDLRKTADLLFEKGTVKGNIKRLNPFNVIAKLGETLEQGPRLGEYRSAKKQGYADEDAFYEATDVTNYRRGGKLARAVNPYDNFLNATIQGNSRVLRAFEEAPARTIARGVTYLTGASLAAYAVRYSPGVSEKQREELRNLSEFEKNTFLHIPYPFEGSDAIIAIPKAFAVGQLFMNPVERALDDYTDNTLGDKSVDQHVRDNIKTTLKSFAPPTDIVLGTTALELSQNKDFFTGNEIESSYDIKAGVEKQDREAYNQSYLTNIISDVINAMSFSSDEGGIVSPAQVDFLVKDLIGSVGRNTLEASDSFLSENAPTRTLEDTLLRPLTQFTTDPTRASGVKDPLKTLAAREKSQNTDLDSLVGDSAKNDERARRAYQNIEQQFKDIDKSIQSVRKDTSLSSQEKKDRIIYLREQQDSIGSATIDYYNSLK